MPDEITRLTSELARDPASRSSIQLAEALRRARQLGAAHDAARRALARHPYDAEAHDVLARIAVDLGDETMAMDEWEMAIRLDPRSLPAILGLAFLAFRAGNTDEAARRVAQGRAVAPEDARVAAAERMLAGARPPRPASPALEESSRPVAPVGVAQPAPATVAATTGGAAVTAATLFTSILEAGAAAALLVDRDGLIVAGRGEGLAGTPGPHAAEDLAAELAGLGTEATRALQQLKLGEWEGITVECDTATLSIAPSVDENLVVVSTPQATPLGMARVLLVRARQRAERWLEAL